MGEKKPSAEGPINLGTAVSAVLLTAVLAAEQQELVAVPDKGSSYHALANTDSVGLHLDYRMPSNDVTVQLDGIRMNTTVGTVQLVIEPAPAVSPSA
jgi:hypothetical protein